jgi:multidrug efflux pump subunit AcrA (membrane-fusion protein)
VANEMGSAGSRPQPDPTALTTEALHREIAALKELAYQRIDQLERVYNEKCALLARELELREQQRIEQKQDTKAAVDAALAAAREAVVAETGASQRAIEKAEAATSKAVDQLGEKFGVDIHGLRRELDTLKERFVSDAGVRRGSMDRRQQQGVSMGQLIAVLGVGVGLLAVIVSVVVSLTVH